MTAVDIYGHDVALLRSTPPGPIHCAECGELVAEVDQPATPSLSHHALFVVDTRCPNTACRRHGQTWTVHDYRGLSDERKADLAAHGILLD